MNGFLKSDLGLMIGHIPERKRPVIIVRNGNSDYVIGQLRSDKEADLLIRVLWHFLGNEADTKEALRYLETEYDIA